MTPRRGRPGEPPDATRRSREALEAALDEAPPDLTLELDPSLIQDGDPPTFPGRSRSVGRRFASCGSIIRTRAALLRIYTALGDREGDGSGRAILHGPEWSFFETGAQSALSWWKEDVLHGPVKQWRPVGTLKFERRYVDGERDGLSRGYSKAGRLVSEEIFDEGQRDGPLREWFASGERKEEAEYVLGKRQGERKLFTRRGCRCAARCTWTASSTAAGATSMETPGVSKSYGSFEMGQRVGVWEEATEAGTVIASRQYAAGELHGTTRIWAADGTLIEERSTPRAARPGRRGPGTPRGRPSRRGGSTEGLAVAGGSTGERTGP